MRIHHGILPVLALAVSACATLQVTSDYDPDYDFTVMRSYGWLPAEAHRGTDIRINNALVNDRVVAAVDAEFAARGLRRVEADAAEVLVTWVGLIDRKLRVDSLDDFYGSWWRGGHRCCLDGYRRTLVREYEEGTLIIDVLDAADRKLVWRGTGTDYLQTARSPAEATENIRQVVAEILAGFPPAVREAGGAR